MRSQAKSKSVFYILMAISAALLAPYSGCDLATKTPLLQLRDDDGNQAEDAAPLETANEDTQDGPQAPSPTKTQQGLADIEKLLGQ